MEQIQHIHACGFCTAEIYAVCKTCPKYDPNRTLTVSDWEAFQNDSACIMTDFDTPCIHFDVYHTAWGE